MAALPDRAELIHWVARWWYEGGTEAAPDRLPQATEFVEEVTGRIAAFGDTEGAPDADRLIPGGGSLLACVPAGHPLGSRRVPGRAAR